jgi:hypothetical protein
MAQETWLVVAVGAGFLLLGIAASPLGWIALLHRRSRADRETERALRALGDKLRDLRTRVERCESTPRVRHADEAGGDGLLPLSDPLSGHRPGPSGKAGLVRVAGTGREGITEPKLIKVPRLSPAQDRQAMESGLSRRYAAIWELAEGGASPDAIARATGQPIGQIELILGLRRQLDPGRTNIPHASHE